MNLKTNIAAALLGAVLLSPGPAAAVSIADARDAVVRETMTYLNTPYLWGGMHPATGMDCSAFTKLVYARAGLDLPRVARDQFARTLYLSPAAALPGDLIFFSMKDSRKTRVDHVGIYVGKGFFVHASVTNGVHIDSVYNPYYLRHMVSLRKYGGF